MSRYQNEELFISQMCIIIIYYSKMKLNKIYSSVSLCDGYKLDEGSLIYFGLTLLYSMWLIAKMIWLYLRKRSKQYFLQPPTSVHLIWGMIAAKKRLLDWKSSDSPCFKKAFFIIQMEQLCLSNSNTEKWFFLNYWFHFKISLLIYLSSNHLINIF